MKRTGILMISLLALSSFLLLSATTPAKADEGAHTIFIGVITGQSKYNVTSIDVEPGVTYTITFVNDDPNANHNLRIDKNDDLEDNGNIADSNDILIGVENDAAGAQGTWTGTWTAPDENSEILYYCGFQGHYNSGMYGTFIVGEGDSPGFGFFFAFAALLLTAVAIPRIRRK